MVTFERLTKQNYVLYAAKAYDNPHCIEEKEFYDDLKRVKYVTRLLNRYKKTGIIKVRHILNHLILFTNVFGVECGVRLLFFKVDHELWTQLKTFLVYLGMMPEVLRGIGDIDILYSSDIPLDMKIHKELRAL